MEAWILLVLINTQYVSTATSYPPFQTEADCIAVLKAIKTLDDKNASVEVKCVETHIAVK